MPLSTFATERDIALAVDNLTCHWLAVFRLSLHRSNSVVLGDATHTLLQRCLNQVITEEVVHDHMH